MNLSAAGSLALTLVVIVATMLVDTGVDSARARGEAIYRRHVAEATPLSRYRRLETHESRFKDRGGAYHISHSTFSLLVDLDEGVIFVTVTGNSEPPFEAFHDFRSDRSYKRELGGPWQEMPASQGQVDAPSYMWPRYKTEVRFIGEERLDGLEVYRLRVDYHYAAAEEDFVVEVFVSKDDYLLRRSIIFTETGTIDSLYWDHNQAPDFPDDLPTSR